jgi:hypothetical protein
MDYCLKHVLICDEVHLCKWVHLDKQQRTSRRSKILENMERYVNWEQVSLPVLWSKYWLKRLGHFSVPGSASLHTQWYDRVSECRSGRMRAQETRKQQRQV